MGISFIELGKGHMAIERRWLEVPSQLLTSNGTQYGQITVPSTLNLKVKQIIFLRSNTQPPQQFVINRINSITSLELGRKGRPISDRADLTLFTTADSSTLNALEQERPAIIPDEYERAVYEEEPTVAKRVVLVDPLGNKYTLDNPLPTNASFEGSITINLNGTGVGGDTVGIVGVTGNRVIVNADGSININDDDLLAALNNINTSLGGTLSVSDTATQTLLVSIAGILSGTLDVNDTNTQAILTSIQGLLSGTLSVSLADEPIKISGTENGLPAGPEFTFVNNLRLQILAAKDRDQTISYSDFGTKDQRVTQIDYLSPSIGTGLGFTARKTILYTLVGTKYRRDKIIWSLV